MNVGNHQVIAYKTHKLVVRPIHYQLGGVNVPPWAIAARATSSITIVGRPGVGRKRRVEKAGPIVSTEMAQEKGTPSGPEAVC